LKGRPLAFWWAIGASALMIVGGLGPWATALSVIDVSGTHGDGWLVIGAGVLAAAILLTSPSDAGPIVGILAAIGGLLVGVIDLNDIQSRSALVEPAWGIYAVLAGSIALGVASVALLAGRRRA
jgi:hypothetical protein